MSSQPQSLPPAWVDRIFGRFSAVWGAQKLGAMYPAESQGEVRRVWGEQLARFSGDTIGRAIQQQIDAGREWPPSLSEFVECCRLTAVARAQHQPAVALPAPEIDREATAVDREIAQQLVRAVNPKTGREWAAKILARADTGEQIPFAVLQMARVATAAPTEAAAA